MIHVLQTYNITLLMIIITKSNVKFYNKISITIKNTRKTIELTHYL